MERGTGKTTLQLKNVLSGMRPRDRIYFVCPTRASMVYSAELFRHLIGMNNSLEMTGKARFTFHPSGARITFVCPDDDPFRLEPATEIVFDHAFDDYGVGSKSGFYEQWRYAVQRLEVVS